MIAARRVIYCDLRAEAATAAFRSWLPHLTLISACHSRLFRSSRMAAGKKDVFSSVEAVRSAESSCLESVKHAKREGGVANCSVEIATPKSNYLGD
jgi:hypothetical protein